MKKIIVLLFAVFSFTFVFAQEPFEFGVISPAQLNGPETSVEGVRLGLIYTENVNVTGVDVNLVAERTKGNFKGVSLLSFYDRTDGDFTGVRIPWSLPIPLSFNSVGRDFLGAQFGGLNIVDGSGLGFQMGLVNLDNSFTGVRVGGVNYAKNFYGGELAWVNISENAKGVQIGLFNYSENLQGIQLGLLNIAKNSELFPALPLINFNLNF